MSQPSRLGKYELIEKVGAGGMAEVFRARRVDLAGAPGADRDYAVKLLNDDLGRDPLLVSMFVDEARLAAQLRHPSIVRLVEFSTDERGRLYMVMEYVDGRDLRSCLATAARAQYWLPVEFSLTVARELCRALEYAHVARGQDGQSLQIVHRDVSHSNVFLSRSGEIKLADFGIARARGRRSKTRTGLVKGKLGYLSPEQVRAERLDGRSDIFSLFVVLWELLTQRRMFVGETEFKTMVAVCTEPRVAPSRYRPGLPAVLDELVLRGVEIERDGRFVDAAEARRSIERTAAAIGLELGPRIVSDVIRYLDRASASFAPEDAAGGAVDAGESSAVARLAARDGIAGIATPSGLRPSEPSDDGSLPVLGDSTPSDVFLAFDAEDAVETDAAIVAESDPSFPTALPPLPARAQTAGLAVTDRPILFSSLGQVQPLVRFEDLVDALDPRRRHREDAFSADGQTWRPAERFAWLAGLPFATALHDPAGRAVRTRYSGTSLVGLVADLAINGFTGRLIVDRGATRVGLVLEAGGLIEAHSTRAAHQLLASLAAAGVLPDARALQSVLLETLRDEVSVDDVLERRHGVPRPDLDRLRRATAREAFRELLVPGEAICAHERTDGWPGRGLLTDSVLEWVLPAVDRTWSEPHIERVLRGLDGRVAFTPGFPLIARLLHLGVGDGALLDTLRAGRPWSAVLSRFSSGDEAAAAARRLAAVLVEAGAVRSA